MLNKKNTKKTGTGRARLKTYFVAFWFRKMMGCFATNSVIDSHYTIKSIVETSLAERAFPVNPALEIAGVKRVPIELRQVSPLSQPSKFSVYNTLRDHVLIARFAKDWTFCLWWKCCIEFISAFVVTRAVIECGFQAIRNPSYMSTFWTEMWNGEIFFFQKRKFVHLNSVCASTVATSEDFFDY